jgi:hypothetical protein
MKGIPALTEPGTAPVLMDTILHLDQALQAWRLWATTELTVEARLAAVDLIRGRRAFQSLFSCYPLSRLRATRGWTVEARLEAGCLIRGRRAF